MNSISRESLKVGRDPPLKGHLPLKGIFHLQFAVRAPECGVYENGSGLKRQIRTNLSAGDNKTLGPSMRLQLHSPPGIF